MGLKGGGFRVWEAVGGGIGGRWGGEGGGSGGVLFWVWVGRVRGRDYREEGMIQYISDRGTGKRGGS